MFGCLATKVSPESVQAFAAGAVEQVGGRGLEGEVNLFALAHGVGRIGTQLHALAAERGDDDAAVAELLDELDLRRKTFACQPQVGRPHAEGDGTLAGCA